MRSVNLITPDGLTAVVAHRKRGQILLVTEQGCCDTHRPAKMGTQQKYVYTLSDERFFDTDIRRANLRALVGKTSGCRHLYSKC